MRWWLLAVCAAGCAEAAQQTQLEQTGLEPDTPTEAPTEDPDDPASPSGLVWVDQNGVVATAGVEPWWIDDEGLIWELDTESGEVWGFPPSGAFWDSPAFEGPDCTGELVVIWSDPPRFVIEGDTQAFVARPHDVPLVYNTTATLFDDSECVDGLPDAGTIPYYEMIVFDAPPQTGLVGPLYLDVL